MGRRTRDPDARVAAGAVHADAACARRDVRRGAVRAPCAAGPGQREGADARAAVFVRQSAGRGRPRIPVQRRRGRPAVAAARAPCAGRPAVDRAARQRLLHHRRHGRGRRAVVHRHRHRPRPFPVDAAHAGCVGEIPAHRARARGARAGRPGVCGGHRRDRARARRRVPLPAGREPRRASGRAARAHTGADRRRVAGAARGRRADRGQCARDAVRQSRDGGRRAGGAGDARHAPASPASDITLEAYITLGMPCLERAHGGARNRRRTGISPPASA